MLECKYIFFDLDGTVTDPRAGITRSVAYALDRYGIHVEDTDSLCPFIGPPLNESFMNFYGFSYEESMKAVEVYRERFATIGLFENEEYPGVTELLSSLRAAGRHLAIATSKPEVFARRILDHFGYTQYFDVIAGSELDGSRVHKDEVIEYARRQLGSPDDSECLMIGDREHDVMGAKRGGMKCIGVLYGYGSREELERAGADFICADPFEVRSLILD